MPLDPAVRRLTWNIINCAITVHKALGPGLLESAYFACLVVELRSRGLQVDVDVRVPIEYREVKVDCAYRLDAVVNGIVILELKAVAAILPVHEAQLVTYLKLTGKPVGLLLNFNVPVMKDGITRKLNDLKD
jgi:GxxExxY protein